MLFEIIALPSWKNIFTHPVHYTHEKRLKLLERDIHEVYHNTFRNTNLDRVKLIAGYRNKQKTKAGFIRRKRPHDKLRQHNFQPGKSPYLFKSSNYT